MKRPSIRVLGLGSPHGDDRAGWEVIARLQARLQEGIDMQAIADPLGILDVAASCELLIVADACRNALASERLYRFEWPDARLSADWNFSSHGIGLIHALQLSEQLGKLPQRIVLIAIVARSCEPGAKMSALVSDAVNEAVELILALQRTLMESSQ